MTLKTLNDLIYIGYKGLAEIDVATMKVTKEKVEYYKDVKVKELRRLMVKWIKQLRGDYIKLSSKAETRLDKEMLKLKTDFCIEWIKYVFNLK